MKSENECYVLMTKIDNEALYLTEDYGFDENIGCALKIKNRITAQFIRSNLEIKHKCYLEIVPLKITYEW